MSITVAAKRLQNNLLIWLDSNANDDTEDWRNTNAKLQRVVSNVHTYKDGDRCFDFIQTNKDSRIYLVTMGFIGQSMVPRVHDMPQVQAIFVHCGNKDRHEQWATAWSKVTGVYTEIDSIFQMLRKTIEADEPTAGVMSFLSPDEPVDRLDSSFMYTQILKEILLTIEFNDEHIRNFADHCREVLIDEWEHIEQLEEHYRERTPIWWYTYECFLYPMLNRALRTMDCDIIVQMGFFIKDLHRHIERVHREQSTSTFTVYRGQYLSNDDFDQLTRTKGGLLSFNSFLSTSRQRQVSEDFARTAVTDPDRVGILFEMNIDPTRSSTAFASIGGLSAMDDEDEVLFAMHSVFRIHEIKPVRESDRLYQVQLSLTNDSDRQLHALTERIREESFPQAQGWVRLALVLKKMGRLKQAEQIYADLLQSETSESGQTAAYNQLGTIKASQGRYQEAITFFERALASQQQTLPVNHLDLATSYNNIGSAYFSLGSLPQALTSHQKALSIREQSLPPAHPDVAKSSSNIASVYYSMGDFPQALTSYEHVLASQQQSLPATHPDLASTHNNLGMVHLNMNDLPKALASHETALSIRQQSLPANHPEIAGSYMGLGLVYHAMHDYLKAVESQEKAISIQEQTLPPMHPDLAASYNNLGAAYKNMGDYPHALELYNKALSIKQQSLPSAHPSLASSFANVGLLYETMNDPLKASRFFERAVQIAQQSLPSTHPHLQRYKNDLERIQRAC